MKLLENKVALVTGASRGIGREIALEYARHGAKVMFTFIGDPEPAAELEKEIAALGAVSRGFPCDATDMARTQEVVDEIVKQYERIDIIVNNAGITMDTLLLRMSEEQFNTVLRVNLNSVFYTAKAALRYMLKQRAGSFINIASVVGVTGNAGQANYAASKGGMISFTKSLAKEVASRGIRANAVAPGFIATEMTAKIPKEELDKWLVNVPLSRPGTPTDVAQLCVFLGSDMSAYITGQVIHVDGGMVM